MEGGKETAGGQGGCESDSKEMCIICTPHATEWMLIPLHDRAHRDLALPISTKIVPIPGILPIRV